jgi:stage V sporulation protein R
MGHPVIRVTDGNFRNRAELLLEHEHEEGVDLEIKLAQDTLRKLHRIWQRPVNLKTVLDDQPKIYTFDGEEQKAEDVQDPPDGV